MALADSKEAIGAVSELLQTRLTANTSVGTVDIGRPEDSAKGDGPKFNLFLYQIDIDGNLRNTPLDEGQEPPLWLVLRYLLTAVDGGKDSDSLAAHKLLGEGMMALQSLNFIQPGGSPALADNPESLKITFDVADSELLSKVMQGSDEKYRVSAAFQIRPVMIAPFEPPRYALPVETVGPPGAEGVTVIPSLGPKLDSLTPNKFTAGETLSLTGTDLGEVEAIRLDNTAFAVTAAPAGEIQAVIDTDTDLSPGNYAITAVRPLPSGKEISSNAVLGQLLPNLDTATPSGLALNAGFVTGTLTLDGDHLGKAEDAIYVAFYRSGRIALMREATVITEQTQLQITVGVDDEIEAGEYFIILRVNGAQATDAPQVEWQP